VFLKIDVIRRSPTYTASDGHDADPDSEVLWRNPPVLALAALPGTALG
jgi:hypothetical protein